jgi:hypothetical protein
MSFRRHAHPSFLERRATVCQATNRRHGTASARTG